MKVKLFKHQEEVLSQLVALSEENDQVCLAACTGFGKTIVAAAFLEDYLRKNPGHRVLVLAHGSTNIRGQFADSWAQAEPTFSYREVKRGGALPGDEVQVWLAIPQTVAKKSLPKFDLVVFDEAHQFSDAEMAADIVERCGIGRRLDLTATPAAFVKAKVPIVAFSLLEALSAGAVANPTVKLACSNYTLSHDDYAASGELRADAVEARLTRQATVEAVEAVEHQMLDLLLRQVARGGHTRSEKTESRWFARKFSSELEAYDRLEKTLYVCPGRAQASGEGPAHFVYDHLVRRGVGAVLSDGETDPDSEALLAFRRDPSIKVAVVVRRANVGFDLPGLGAVVDLTQTRDPNRIMQMVGRLVRIDKQNLGQSKLFIKVVPTVMKEYSEHLVGFSMMLAHRGTLLEWDGSNPVAWKIPGFGGGGAEREPRERDPDAPARPRGEPVPEIRPLAGLTFSEFFEEVAPVQGDGALRVYAATTLGMVREKYDGVRARNQDANRALQWCRDNKRLPSRRSGDPAERRLRATVDDLRGRIPGFLDRCRAAARFTGDKELDEVLEAA